jgi:hypothetical protein
MVALPIGTDECRSVEFAAPDHRFEPKEVTRPDRAMSTQVFMRVRWLLRGRQRHWTNRAAAVSYLRCTPVTQRHTATHRHRQTANGAPLSG